MKITDLLYAGAALLLTMGCSSDEPLAGGSETEERIPLRLEATLSDGTGMMRAAGKEFAAGDVLKAYLRHVTISGTDPDFTYTLLDGSYDWKQRLVDFTVNNGASMTVLDDNTKQTSDLTVTGGLYWDDFSQGAKGDDTDIRTDNHGLQSYYGYCYNGGTPSTDLNENDGTLGWTVKTDQNTGTNFKNSDLLWSPSQPAVTYAHAASKDANHGMITIPYTHAMSEVTVEVTCDESFTKSKPLVSGSVLLYQMNTVATLTAPTGGCESTTSVNITMLPDPAYSSTATPKTRKYTAVIAPKSKIKVDEKFLDITIDGVKYEVSVTSAMLAADKWATDHTGEHQGTESGKNYILTKPGVNYHLAVNVGKAKITVIATIKNWETLNAEGTGTVHYDNNVASTTVTGGTFVDGSKFSLFRLLYGTATDAANERGNDASWSDAVTSSYSTSDSKWTNSPLIYWTSTTDKYFFRALAKMTAENTITNEGLTSKNTSVSQGNNDILWGTTPTADGYSEGDAIAPRSGDVPISFKHALSKVTFKLQTGTGEALVNLTGAKIAVSNLYTTGTIRLEDGEITSLDGKTGIASQECPNTGLSTFAIPQTIGDDVIVIITLPGEGNAVYKLKLKDCIGDNGTPADATDDGAIGVWEAGKDYTYTITVEKDKVQFRALVKEWTVVQGSGNANLEWD